MLFKDKKEREREKALTLRIAASSFKSPNFKQHLYLIIIENRCIASFLFLVSLVNLADP